MTRRQEDEMALTLSERQQAILRFIRQYRDEHDYPPTIREIGKAANISSTSVVKYNLERLQEKGLINRNKEVSRGLRLVETEGTADEARAPRFVPVPKYGLISAGPLRSLAGQQDNPFAGESLAIAEDLLPTGGDVYALKVDGESMVDAFVCDGDWVIIKHQATAQPRDMIVAWMEDREETTLKYYYPEGAEVRLQPANPAYKPIMVPADQLKIQGKVVAVIRQLA